MQFTSVKVTPAAQKAYLEKNPDKRPTTAAASSSSTATATPLQDTTSATNKKRNAADAGLEASASGSSLKKTKKSKA